MQFHLLAFGSAAFDGSAGLTLLPGIAEQAFSRSAQNNFQIPNPLNLFMAYAGGVGITQARINTGSLRAKGFPQIAPLSAVEQQASTPPMMDFRDYPLYLRKEEDFRIDVANGGAQDTVVIAGVTPDTVNYNINLRDLRMLRFTITLTGAVLAWSAPGTVVFDDVLEGGIYEVFGLSVHHANAIAARLIFQSQFYRPGCLGKAAVTAWLPTMFLGGLGAWGEFNYYSPPQMEFLASAAGAANLTGYMLCAKKSGT